MFKVGCDPEIFLVDKNTLAPICAEGYVTGTKKEPEKVLGGAVQVDGIALELNTDPVDYTDFNGFNRNIVAVLRELSSKVKVVNPDAKFSIVPTQDVTKDFLDKLSESSKELGCDPDFNAYTMEPNPMPDGDRLFRTGAGHLHIGWGADIPVDNPEHMEICADFIKMLDATVGLLMTLLDRDPRRRELYGKAGAFRPKHYGVEYRTPSNVWLRTASARKAVFETLKTAIDYKKQGHTVESLTGRTSSDIRSIIDTGNHAEAGQILRTRIAGRTLHASILTAVTDIQELTRRDSAVKAA